MIDQCIEIDRDTFQVESSDAPSRTDRTLPLRFWEEIWISNASCVYTREVATRRGLVCVICRLCHDESEMTGEASRLEFCQIERLRYYWS